MKAHAIWLAALLAVLPMLILVCLVVTISTPWSITNTIDQASSVFSPAWSATTSNNPPIADPSDVLDQGRAAAASGVPTVVAEIVSSKGLQGGTQPDTSTASNVRKAGAKGIAATLAAGVAGAARATGKAAAGAEWKAHAAPKSVPAAAGAEWKADAAPKLVPAAAGAAEATTAGAAAKAKAKATAAKATTAKTAAAMATAATATTTETKATGDGLGNQRLQCGGEESEKEIRATMAAGWSASTAPEFGRVELSGEGLDTVPLHTSTCFTIAAYDTDGQLFDRSCMQRAFFIVQLQTPDPKPTPAAAPAPDATFTKQQNRGGRSVQEGEVEAGPGKVRLAAEVTYKPETSSHEACYQLPLPGSYLVEVFLVFTNTFRVLREVRTGNMDGFSNYTVVAEHTVHALGGLPNTTLHSRAHLPPCTLSSLDSSRLHGYWLDDKWFPFHCRLRRFTPAQLSQCLDGKNILFAGDSEMRYTFGTFINFLRQEPDQKLFEDPRAAFPVRNEYLQRIGFFHASPLDKTTRTAIRTVVENMTYYGHFYSGFINEHLHMPSTNGNGSLNFNATYLTVMQSGSKVIQDWMSNPKLADGEVPYHPGRPFDLILYSSMLHDLTKQNQAEGLPFVLSTSLVPQLLSMVKNNRSRVLYFGPWSAREDMKWFPPYIVSSNNPRGFSFFDNTARLLLSSIRPNILPMRSITLPRHDLCLDSTHYSWPVTLTMIQIAFSDLCR